MKTLVAPAKPSTKTFAQLTEQLDKHLHPKPLVIAEIFRFQKRDQNPGEGVLQYIAELRKLAITCNFGNVLDDKLRNRFVCGLHAENIQKHLLSEDELTLEKTSTIAVAMETAASDASELQGQRGQTADHIISMKSHKQKHPNDVSSGHKTLSYFRCNGDHKANDCVHINAICRYCHIKGHIEIACLKKRRDKRNNRGSFRRRTQKGGGVYRLHDRGSESDSDDWHILHINANNIRGKHSSPIMVEPIIAGKPFRMELDTGTALSVISEKDYKANFRNIALDPCRT